MNFPFFPVDKAIFMVGSYGPRPEEYEFLTPIEEAPKGMLARGTYHNKSFFTDDDKHDHLTWEWNLSIKKEWTEWAHLPIPVPALPPGRILYILFTSLSSPLITAGPPPQHPSYLLVDASSALSLSLRVIPNTGRLKPRLKSCPLWTSIMARSSKSVPQCTIMKYFFSYSHLWNERPGITNHPFALGSSAHSHPWIVLWLLLAQWMSLATFPASWILLFWETLKQHKRVRIKQLYNLRLSFSCFLCLNKYDNWMVPWRGWAGHSRGGIYITDNSLGPLFLQWAMNLQNMTRKFICFMTLSSDSCFLILRPMSPTAYGSLLKFHNHFGPNQTLFISC